MYLAGSCFFAACAGCAAAILLFTSFSKASLVFSVVYKIIQRYNNCFKNNQRLRVIIKFIILPKQMQASTVYAVISAKFIIHYRPCAINMIFLPKNYSIVCLENLQPFT